jgi:hypothetical protein
MITQPVTLPFPGVPAWEIFVCACWLEKIQENGQELRFPQHIEAAQTIEAAHPGTGVGCRRCDTFWLLRQNEGTWARFHLNNIRMSGAERLAHYTEGQANELFEADGAAGDTESDTLSPDGTHGL